MGKTIFSIYLACKIKLKTLIICHRIVLIDQFHNSILKVCLDPKVQILTSKCKIDMEADFYIINAINVPKRDREDFSHIGTLIADEVHLLCTEKFSKAFQCISPKYSIGLTATPTRPDIIEVFFGPNIIYRPLRAVFNAYLYYTNFIPKIESNEKGELNWHSVLESQSMDKKRNTLIVDLVRYFATRNILILCKRKKHALIIKEGLEKYNESVDIYLGSQRFVNYNCRILVVTYSKGSVGFDAPNLNMLIVAGDMEENFVQPLGRIFRQEYQHPIVIDLIDNFRPLQKHSTTRCNVYKEAGAAIKNLNNYFSFENWRRFLLTDLDSVYENLDDDIEEENNEED
jgi:superfamily II DNA or RNA helicase